MMLASIRCGLGNDGIETSNEHYGELNRRFDLRAWSLLSLGFKYERLTAYNIAVFTRERFGRRHTIAAGTVMNADDMVWRDTMESASRFAS